MMYRTTRSAFEQIDHNIISAARTLGLSELKIFYKIAIPLAWPGIMVELYYLLLGLWENLVPL